MEFRNAEEARESGLQVACAQPLLTNSPERNLETIWSFCQKAAWHGAKLAVFPEAALTGYDLKNARETAIVASNRNQSFARLLEISETEGIALATGFFERDGKKIYNSYGVFSEGRLVAKYRKIALFPLTGEDRIFAPGDRTATFKLGGFTFGLAVCYDLRFPKIFEKYVGVDALLVGACFFHERIDQWEVLVRARALELQCYAIGCNALLPGINCHGHSLIAGPDGSIASMAQEKEQLLTCELRKSEIGETRRKMPVLRDRKKIRIK